MWTTSVGVYPPIVKIRFMMFLRMDPWFGQEAIEFLEESCKKYRFPGNEASSCTLYASSIWRSYGRSLPERESWDYPFYSTVEMK